METFSALLAVCVGNSLVTGEFPSQRSVTRSFDVFFDLRLNTRLSKQSWSWWFETPSRPLWRRCNAFMFVNSDRIRFGVVAHHLVISKSWSFELFIFSKVTCDSRYSIVFFGFFSKTLSILLTLCDGNPSVTDGFPLQKFCNAELWRC